jgi:hypothetical protein
MRRIQLEKIMYVVKDSGGFRATGMRDTSVEAQVPLIGLRAAVTPPRSDRPGYYLILGMRFEKNESGKHPLIFLGEHEDELQSSLFKRFYNDAARLAVERVYADEGNPGFFQVFG